MKRTITLILTLIAILALMLCSSALAENYPESKHPYPSAKEETWTYVHPDPAVGLWVTFSEETQFEQDCDYLTIIDYDGLHTDYTGTSLSGRRLFLPGNSFSLCLRSDPSTEYYGFSITDISAATDADYNEYLQQFFIIEPDGVITAYTGCAAKVTIPSEINGIKVTAIGPSAFLGETNTTLTTIVIPEGVTEIGEGALGWQENLTEVFLPESLTKIGSGAFAGCANLEKINIPKGVTEIDAHAFSECYALTEVTLPGNLTSISSGLFERCYALTSVTLPEKLTEIGDYAFSECYSLEKINIPAGVTAIGFSAFFYCTSLTEVTLPEDVSYIDYDVFCDCYSLERVTFPSRNVPKICEGSIPTSAIIVCYRNSEVETWAKKNNYKVEYIDGEPETISISGSIIWNDCDNQDGFRPANVTVYLMANDEVINTISVTPEDDWAWAFNDLLKYENGEEIFYTISQKQIYGYTTEVCGYDVTNIHIPETIELSGSVIWNDCDNQDGFRPAEITIRLYADDKIINDMTVSADHDWTWAFTDLPKYRDQGMEIFYGIFADAVEGYTTEICGYDITNTYIPAATPAPTMEPRPTPAPTAEPENIIDSGACGENLTWTLNDEGVLTISGEGEMLNYSASGSASAPWYSYRESIISVVIGEGVTTIGVNAFYHCSNLASIAIPDSVTSIGGNAFWGCSGLTEITIPDSVTFIGGSAFHGCSGLTEITIPDSVTSIYAGTFDNCTRLTSINIPYGVTSIEMLAFNNCRSLASINIPDSVNSINSQAFSCCESLTSVVIGNGVTTIDYGAFGLCESLTSVVIPDSVTFIGADAFGLCSALEKVTFLGEDVPEIGSDAIPASAVIVCLKGSKVEAWAKDNQYTVEYIVSSEPTIAPTIEPTAAPTVAPTVMPTIEPTVAPTVEPTVTPAPTNHPSLSLDAVYLDGTLYWTLDYCGPYDLYLTEGGNGIRPNDIPLLADLTETSDSYSISLDPSTVYAVTAKCHHTPYYQSTTFLYPASSELALPDDLTTIEEEAFAGTDIERVIIPASVTEIGSRAFADCESLHYIVFEGDSITIAEDAFDGCRYIVFVCSENSDAAIYAAGSKQLGCVHK